ncbi:MAG: hypothetical protein ABR540_21540 [Acidimicrobiales bacterium]
MLDPTSPPSASTQPGRDQSVLSASSRRAVWHCLGTPGLLGQLAALEFETTESRTIRIAERAGHDDLAMALALATHHQAPFEAGPGAKAVSIRGTPGL